MVSLERLSGCSTGNCLHHRGLDLDKAALMKKLANFASHSAALEKDLSRFRICDQVEIALTIANFDVGHAVPFVGQWTKRFRQHLKSSHSDRRFTGLSDKTFSFHSQEVSQVEQLKNLCLVWAKFLQVHENLDPTTDIA